MSSALISFSCFMLVFSDLSLVSLSAHNTCSVPPPRPLSFPLLHSFVTGMLNISCGRQGVFFQDKTQHTYKFNHFFLMDGGPQNNDLTVNVD